MTSQMCFPRKLKRAVGKSEGFLTRMDPHLIIKRPYLSESLRAFATLVRFYPCMNTHMLFKSPLVFKFHGAFQYSHMVFLNGSLNDFLKSFF